MPTTPNPIRLYFRARRLGLNLTHVGQHALTKAEYFRHTPYYAVYRTLGTLCLSCG